VVTQHAPIAFGKARIIEEVDVESVLSRKIFHAVLRPRGPNCYLQQKAIQYR
jgi:hypothetical protein